MKILPIFPLILLILILILENDASPTNDLHTKRGIIFPSKENFDECFVDDLQQHKGTCKTLGECPLVLERWDKQNIVPKTCYFKKFEQFVCCENKNASSTTNTPENPPNPKGVKRRSEQECNRAYGTAFIILYGEPAGPDEFPFMAALGWRSNVGNLTIYRCGGVLISSKFVLTAAHCVDLGGEPPYVVRLGGGNLTDPNVENIKIKSITVHPDYNVSSSYNDIALIELKENASENPICVWSEEELQQNNVTAIGYGHTRFGGISSDQLLKVPLFLVSNNICQRHYKAGTQFLQNGVVSTHVCAGDPEGLRDTCQGDSGGPIIMKFESNYDLINYVVGITSFGQGCAGGPPSIYTRTSSYIDWIESIVWPPFDIRKNMTNNGVHLI